MTRVERLQKQLDEMALASQAEESAFGIYLSWRAFKSFVEQLTDEQRAGLGVEFVHFADRDNVIWAEWRINVVNEDGGEGHVGFLWFRDVTPELFNVRKGLFYWPECEKGLEDFWRQVEAMPAFRAALSLDGWKAERIN